jgi:hypothetical protein
MCGAEHWPMQTIWWVPMMSHNVEEKRSVGGVRKYGGFDRQVAKKQAIEWFSESEFGSW